MLFGARTYVGRRYLFIRLMRNLLANIDWRTGLPGAEGYQSITTYMREFAKKFDACFDASNAKVVGCEDNPSMLVPDTYNHIIIGENEDPRKYVQYLAPGGKILLNSEVIYEKPRVVVYVPCSALTTYGGLLTPIEVYSVDWDVVGCTGISDTNTQEPATITICGGEVRTKCVPQEKLVAVLTRFMPIDELRNVS